MTVIPIQRDRYTEIIVPAAGPVPRECALGVVRAVFPSFNIERIQDIVHVKKDRYFEITALGSP